MTKIRNQQFLKDFGQKVKAIRIAKKLSQYELSYSSDIPKSQIVRIEQGEVNTGISSVAALAKALNVSPKELFDF